MVMQLTKNGTDLLRVFILVIIFSFHLFGQTVRRYEGVIGKAKVAMTLNFFDSTIGGSYYYKFVGQPIEITGEIKSNIIKLEAYVPDTSSLSDHEYFNGKIDQDKISGTWNKGKNILSFNLKSQNTWNPKHLPSRDGTHIDQTISIKINDTLPKYYLRYMDYFVPFEKESIYGTYYFRVELRRNKKEKPFQVIESESDADLGPLDSDGVDQDLKNADILTDINFDGFKDLRFKIMEGAARYRMNKTYAFYIYNPAKGMFIYNKDVSSLMNPTAIKKLNIIRTYDLYPDYERINEYKWMGDSLFFLKSRNIR
jgi:hypothetical protein